MLLIFGLCNFKNGAPLRWWKANVFRQSQRGERSAMKHHVCAGAAAAWWQCSGQKIIQQLQQLWEFYFTSNYFSGLSPTTTGRPCWVWQGSASTSLDLLNWLLIGFGWNVWRTRKMFSNAEIENAHVGCFLFSFHWITK